MSHRVIGAGAQVTVGGRVHTILRGDIVPEGVEPGVLAGLVEKGLIESFEAEVAETESETEVEAPVKSWNHERIDAWAAQQEPPIVFVPNEDASKALTKEQKLKQIADAVAERSTEQ